MPVISNRFMYEEIFILVIRIAKGEKGFSLAGIPNGGERQEIYITAIAFDVNHR